LYNATVRRILTWCHERGVWACPVCCRRCHLWRCLTQCRHCCAGFWGGCWSWTRWPGDSEWGPCSPRYPTCHLTGRACDLEEGERGRGEG